MAENDTHRHSNNPVEECAPDGDASPGDPESPDITQAEQARPPTGPPELRDIVNREARMSWVLAAVAGLIGAAAFTHSAGYFVTFMTGNSERAVLGLFRNEQWLSISAALLLASFVGGVVIASLCRRHLWLNHPHGPTVLTALSLMLAAIVDAIVDGWSTNEVSFVPVLFAAFGIGALNTSFVRAGEVSIPLSYVTGTLVKMGQGIERHISGGRATEWLGYFLLWASFIAGATIGGAVSLVISGSQMLAAAAAVCIITSGYTFFHVDRRALRQQQCPPLPPADSPPSRPIRRNLQ